jgi:hypothetical protein
VLVRAPTSLEYGHASGRRRDGPVAFTVRPYSRVSAAVIYHLIASLLLLDPAVHEAAMTALPSPETKPRWSPVPHPRDNAFSGDGLTSRQNLILP